ncbi:MAG: hypothetical protein AB7R89_26335 [Dehalococcoidia bacterium]
MFGKARGHPATEPHVQGEPFRFTVVHVLVSLLLIAIVVTIPFALVSLFEQAGNPTDEVHSVPATSAAPADYRVHLVVSEVDEVAGIVTVLAAAARVCDPSCPDEDVIAVRSINLDVEESLLPVEQRLTFEPDVSTVSREIALPIYGNYLHYPFDDWNLVLQVADADGPANGGTSGPGDGGTFEVTVLSRVPRMEMHPQQEDTSSGAAESVLAFERPVYLQVMTVLTILLIAVIAATVVFRSPVEALIASAAGLVLAVWGIRGILLGTLVPAVSAVDSALILIVMFILTTTLVRIVWLFERRSQFRVLSRLPQAAATQTLAADHRPEMRPPDFIG